MQPACLHRTALQASICPTLTGLRRAARGRASEAARKARNEGRFPVGEARLRGGLLEHARLDAEARGQHELAARHGLALRDERVDAREQLRVLAARKSLARLGELGQRRLFVCAVDEVDALHAPLVRGERVASEAIRGW